jgi:DNA-binding CsgD family transcriptional regulator
MARKHTKTLTRRQREVLELLAQGKTMKEAADILKVTPRTVAFINTASWTTWDSRQTLI